MSFNIQRVNRGCFDILLVSGYMGNDECGELETELEHLRQQGRRYVIIDFVALNFITSASLVRLSKEVRRFQRAEGDLKLASLPLLAIQLIKAGRFGKVLRPIVDLPTAIRSLSIAELLPAKQKCCQPRKAFLHGTAHKKTFVVEPS